MQVVVSFALLLNSIEDDVPSKEMSASTVAANTTSVKKASFICREQYLCAPKRARRAAGLQAASLARDERAATYPGEAEKATPHQHVPELP